MATLLDIVPKGSTARSVTVRILDATNGVPNTALTSTELAAWYRREGSTRTAITVSAVTADGDAWTSGGFKHIDDGEFRLDIPDAAFASGAQHVDIGATGVTTGVVVIGGRVRLIDYNIESTRLSAADVKTQVTTGLVDYDPPTRAELTADKSTIQADINALNDLSAAQVKTQVTTGLVDYGAAKTTDVDQAESTIQADIAGLNDLSAAQVKTQVTTGLVDFNAAKTTEVTKAESTIQSDIAALNNLSAAQVKTQVTTALVDYDPPTRAELTSDKSTIQADINALNDLDSTGVSDAVIVADKRAMVESYSIFDSTAQAAPSKQQALMEIKQTLHYFDINAKTITVKKLDDASTAFTLGLDSSTAPTSASRNG